MASLTPSSAGRFGLPSLTLATGGGVSGRETTAGGVIDGLDDGRVTGGSAAAPRLAGRGWLSGGWLSLPFARARAFSSSWNRTWISDEGSCAISTGGGAPLRIGSGLAAGRAGIGGGVCARAGGVCD